MKIKCVELLITTVKVILILIEMPTRKGPNYMTIFSLFSLQGRDQCVCIVN